MKNKSQTQVSSELLATYLDGNATAQECQEIIGALVSDSELREVFTISQSVDASFSIGTRHCDVLPMTAIAATCGDENDCCLECEKYVLKCLNVNFDESTLLEEAVLSGWQKDEGTALHNVGRHLESAGLVVSRCYNCTLADLKMLLDAESHVIAAVDGSELLGNTEQENSKELPNHTVVVLSYDNEADTITVFDPNTSNLQDTYSTAQFMDAWADSKNYLVSVVEEEQGNYIPHLIDLSDVELGEELIELREAIAEHAHNVWAAERQAQGWTYGPQRDDDKKQTPCMVPYSKLPDSEKTFDRDMAMNTIKLLKKLGYDIIKRE